MWRALVFIGLLALAAWGAVWLADRPGSVVVTWAGVEAQTSVAVAVVGTIVLAMLLAGVWALVRFLMAFPRRLNRRSGLRRRERGFAAVSRGMIAVGSGDPIAARRHAGEAERLLGHEPLTLLLRAQAAQISGDRPAAEAAFRTMAETDETRVLGLRGLFVEARRRGDEPTAIAYATEAARLAPAVSWANEAVLEGQCAAGDWRGALASVERRSSLGLMDKATARRHRAVLLTADALASEDGDPERALAEALDAAKLAPDLVPAAALAGRLLARRGDLRRAAKVIEVAWRRAPHPDLAETYLGLRLGDSALDRLRRAETLARLSSWAPEARLALARAALEARQFGRARDVLRPVIEERPTVRACLLMAEIEEAEHGRDSGRVREWLARATRAPRDAAWIADGVVSEHWAPVSPVTGRLDAFVWQPPPDLLAARSRVLDDVLADVDEEEARVPAEPAALAAPEPAEEAAEVAPAAELPALPDGETPPEGEVRAAASVPSSPALASVPSASEPVRAGVGADEGNPPQGAAPPPPAVSAPPSTPAATAAPAPAAPMTPGPPPAPGPAVASGSSAAPAPPATPVVPAPGAPGAEPAPADAAGRTKPVVFPVPRAPDDPGPEEERAPPKRRLFG